MLKIEDINYDYSKENNCFFITYRNDEFLDLADKINILPTFYKIVIDNGGELVGLKDDFENEEDAENAVNDLKNYLNNNETQLDIFKNFLVEFIDLYDSVTIDKLKEYLFMLDDESIDYIMKIK